MNQSIKTTVYTVGLTKDLRNNMALVIGMMKKDNCQRDKSQIGALSGG